MFRDHFPFFDQVNNTVFLDNAASTQKTRGVLDAQILSDSVEHSNVHRGNYALSRQNTDAFEMTRALTAQFINAQKDEIIFTSGTTFGINLVAYSFVLPSINSDQNIVISIAEHHANLVIWQRITALSGCELRYIELDDNGDYDLLQAQELIDENTFLLSVAHVSNVLGQLQPIKALTTLAKQCGAFVLIDGAQAVAHVDVDVEYLNVDFYAFSAHKMFGPTGLGILYGKSELLNKMPPLIYGGEMVEKVTRNHTTLTKPPHRFEAGTAAISAVIAFAHAIEFMNFHTLENLQAANSKLTAYAFKQLDQIKNIKYISPKSSAGIITFNIKGLHHADIAMLLDEQNIALRAGTFCAQVLFEYLKESGALRIAISPYNNQNDIDLFITALNKAIQILED
ncbi:MAG: aminotransferase class V-fold PLP-dependent enzyme [Saccharospirillaceae bacterium]|nr:aminotransferase class V-fold PLP-dependent enzyme [Pseudomonadales bacterium]NRB79997.1 aminotransferase class V-fold PLP-dependent enzyme [Saccharospirillaceae bacterium]